MERPDINQLREFNTLHSLGAAELEYIADNIAIESAPKGQCLLDLGSNDQVTLFLIEGRLRLLSADGKKQDLSHTDATSKNPLARLRPSRYRITTDSHVRYLRIDNHLLNGSAVLDIKPQRIGVVEDGGDGKGLVDRLLYRIYQDAATHQLSLKSLPEVARHIASIVASDPKDASRIGQTLLLDPSLTLKTLKLAGRLTGRAYTNCTKAVTALGPEEIEKLVAGVAMREVFRSGSKLLQSEARRVWKQAVHVGALCGALANRSERFDPEHATIVGLLHNVGELTILGYTREIPELKNNAEEISKCLGAANEMRRSAFSNCVLSEEITSPVAEADNWHRETSRMGDYADILIVAHLYYARKQNPDSITLPKPEKISAYERLDLNPQALETAAIAADNLLSKLEQSNGL